MSDVHEGGAILDTPESIEAFRWMAARTRLGLEIKLGIPYSSHGKSTLQIVNEILKKGNEDFKPYKRKLSAYTALNEKIVAAIGEKFNRPDPGNPRKRTA